MKAKYLWVLVLLLIFSGVAAQCGAQSKEVKQETVTESSEGGQSQEGDQPTAIETSELMAVSLEPGEKLRVVATNSIVADMVKNVGGELIDLSYLLPLGSDPHSFQATPQDVAKVAAAHALFANGMGLEEFLSELIKNAGGQTMVVSLSEGVETRQMNETEMAADEGAHQDEHSGVDPHTWTTPANAIIFVENIERALSTIDPVNAAIYKANAEKYQGQLKDLDTWVKAQIETIPAENRKLVTDHTVFGYYADRYGLEQVGAVIPSFSTSAEPSAQELAALEKAIRAQGVKAIFVGNTINPGLEQRVAEDTGLKLVTLFTESLGPEGSGAEIYLDYIRYNTNAIVGALK